MCLVSQSTLSLVFNVLLSTPGWQLGTYILLRSHLPIWIEHDQDRSKPLGLKTVVAIPFSCPHTGMCRCLLWLFESLKDAHCRKGSGNQEQKRLLYIKRGISESWACEVW
jgi:hypothetical protein